MGDIIPDEFTVNGNVVISIEKESLMALAAVIVIIITLFLLAQKAIKYI